MINPENGNCRAVGKSVRSGEAGVIANCQVFPLFKILIRHIVIKAFAPTDDDFGTKKFKHFEESRNRFFIVFVRTGFPRRLYGRLEIVGECNRVPNFT